ncbi:MAG: membrane lipoprotein lipid attachment site-containing protein [Paludibacteraceae bacterium]|nr:membrane lipoprotein lipid attachment site-containing protein [Paludibacteraceae bacterium]MBR5972240.1 membrane lipoprotein lipid attachment site-containing protein [Paludibacteraceae bacterium]
MKKIILLISCLAILAGCKNKKAEEPAQPEAQVTETVQEVGQAIEAVSQFLEENKIQAKSFGLRQEEDGTWQLNLKNLDANGEAAGELLKLTLADNVEIVTLESGNILSSALSDETKSALNNKFVGYWLDGDKISHIVEFAK